MEGRRYSASSTVTASGGKPFAARFATIPSLVVGM
jgi:hypothetical protein